MRIMPILKWSAIAVGAPLVAGGVLVARAVIDPSTGAKGYEDDAGYPSRAGRAPVLWQAVQGAETLASSLASRIRGGDTSRVVAPNPGSSATQDAEAAWQALSTSMEVRGMPGAFAASPRGAYHASVWSMSQVLNAALDRAGTTGNWAEVNAVTQRMASLYGTNPSWSDGLSVLPSSSEFAHHPFYDDNAWVVLDLLQAHEMTGDASWLARAEEMTKFLDTGLQADGGVLWGRDEARPSVGTCSAGPVGQVYAQLYATTKDPAYLEKAQRVERYLTSTLQFEDGMYADNIKLDDGHITDWRMSYNQGTPIGLQVELFRATGDRAYLERATRTAKASVQHFAQGDRLWQSPPVFNAIFFRNLLALDEIAPDPSYRALLTDYLERATRDGLDRSTGLYRSGGIGSYDGKATGASIDQAAMVQMFELAGSAKPYR